MKKIKYIMILVISSLWMPIAFAATMSDIDITTAVKNNLAADSTLSGITINVTTTKGVVHLSGKVDSATQAGNAATDAQSTLGVKKVDTEKLTVNVTASSSGTSQQPLKDTLITAKIKGLFIQQKLFGNQDISAMSIHVETKNGIVSLSGTADNKTQATNAIKLAKSVTGVKSVKSTIAVGTNGKST